MTRSGARRRLTPAFIVTASVASGCAGAVPLAELAERFPHRINPRDAQQRLIYKESDGSCYVELPFVEPPSSGGMSPPQQPTACPEEMKDPAWDACIGAAILRNDAGDDCACEVGGNPPPPTAPRVSCPPPER